MQGQFHPRSKSMPFSPCTSSRYHYIGWERERICLDSLQVKVQAAELKFVLHPE